MSEQTERPEAAQDPRPRSPQRRAKPPWHRRPWWWVNVLGSIALALLAADTAVEYALRQIPLPKEVKLPTSARVYDRHGNLIATYRDEVTRFIIDTKRLPDHVRQAVIAAEDRDFFEHDGVSLVGMARAAWENLSAGTVQQGGSTITQQYVKNAVLEDPSRTVERKIKEAILSIKLERQHTKTWILDSYMNTVYFGRGAYGIEAAARTYFAKHAHELTVPEAAYLAGVIPAPAKYQLDGDRKAALVRRQHVLDAMREEGYLTSEQHERASEAKIRLRTAEHLRARRQDAAYFLEWLRKEYLYPRFGDCLYKCGLKIFTTIDMEMQAEAEQAIAEVLSEKGDPPAALVSMTPRGEVRALVGGRDHTSVKAARGYNFATDARRQAGSAFKPFTLLAAIEQGISPSSRFSGESPKPIEDPVCAGPDGQWAPENYGGSSYGTLDLYSATSSSVNTVYAELITEIGPTAVADLLEDLGFTSPDGGNEIDPLCSLSLGTLDVSVMEMTRAYAAIAGGGVLPRVTPIRFVQGSGGKCVLGYGTPKDMKCKKVIGTEGQQVVDPNSAHVLTDVLTGVVEGGTATSAQIGRPAAGKTGTTQDNRDAWFAGYVPQLATVVWMGYPVEKGPDGKAGTADDVSPLMHLCGIPVECRPVHGIDVTGGSFPATIWGRFMAVVLEGVEIASFPLASDTPDTVLNPPPPPPPPEPVEDSEPADSEGGGEGNEKSKSDHGNGKGKD